MSIKTYSIALIFCSLNLFISIQCSAQLIDHFEISHFKLPIETVALDMLEDSSGFLWIGSKNGLWRYDGGHFKQYKRNPKDSTSITDNFISCLYEDKSGVLWVGTYGGGLLKYDRNCDCFQRYIHDENNPNSLSFDEIKAIFETSDNQLYIGTDGGGLNIMNRETGQFRSFKHSMADDTSLSHNNVLSIAEGSNGTIFIGTWIGLNIFHPQKEKFERIYQKNNPENQFFFSLEAFNGKLLASGSPASYLDEEKELSKIEDIDHWISCMHQIDEKYCWLAGDQGISMLDNSLKVVQSIPIDRFNKEGSSVLRKLCVSKQENATWVLSRSGHFYLVEQKPRIFKPFLTDTEVNGLVNRTNGYWTVSDGKLRILNKTDHRTISVFDSFRGNPYIITGNKRGVWAVDQQYYYEFSLSGTLSRKTPLQTDFSITCLTQTSDDKIWIGKILGVNKYDPKKNSLIKYDCDPNDPAGIGYFHQTNKIFEDHHGVVWIGTAGDGLKRFNAETNEFEHFRHRIGDSTTINSNFVNEIFEDRQHNLWLGTNTGLCRLDQQTGVFIQYGQVALQDKTVTSMEQDLNDDLWIGTHSGLLKLNYENGNIRVLNKQDGILSNQFDNISMALEDNQLVFSTNKGPMVFNPADVEPSNEKPGVFISKLWIDNELIRPGSKYISKNIEVEKKILMDYTDKKFELEFQVIHYKNNARCEYAYKLDGFDESWIHVNTNPRATYTNIPPGHYTFQVKASNEDGIWNDKLTQIEIIISPPFWEILWVRVLGVIVLGFLFFLLIRTIMRKERMKTKFEIEKSRILQSEEITQMKLKFFTNISHELRTPLTIITSPLDKYIKSKIVPKAHVLEMMHRNSKRLLELVNQILDFRKLEANQQQLKVKEQKDLMLFQHLHEAYAYWSRDKNIDFIMKLPEKKLKSYFDPDVLEKAISNLLSNALKFTPTSGKVQLEVYFSNVEQVDSLILKGNLIVKVIDNGKGIPKEAQLKIFERFYQADNTDISSSGSGIGLSLTNELVKLHQGEIKVFSNLGEGSCFEVKIPVGRNDYQETTFDEVSNVYPDLNVNSTTILVVEDNKDIRDYLVDELSETYEIIEAENGKIAAQMAMLAIPDMIISDVMMPEVNGIQLANQLKNNELTAHIPIIFLTAKGELDDKIEGLLTGAEDYIQKPFDIQEITLKVRNVLETRKLLVEKYKKEGMHRRSDSKENTYLSKVNDIIRDNLDNPQFSVNVLCEELAVGRSQLYRKVLALTGKSIIEYINTYRLSIAMEMIKEGGYTLKEIAFKVGYNDNHYFSRSFKKEFGRSPSFYSKKEKPA